MTEIPFHPLVRRWFAENFKNGPTAAQEAGWAHIAEGRAALIAAPTGSGKRSPPFSGRSTGWSSAGLRAVSRTGRALCTSRR